MESTYKRELPATSKPASTASRSPKQVIPSKSPRPFQTATASFFSRPPASGLGPSDLDHDVVVNNLNADGSVYRRESAAPRIVDCLRIVSVAPCAKGKRLLRFLKNYRWRCKDFNYDKFKLRVHWRPRNNVGCDSRAGAFRC